MFSFKREPNPAVVACLRDQSRVFASVASPEEEAAIAAVRVALKEELAASSQLADVTGDFRILRFLRGNARFKADQIAKTQEQVKAYLAWRLAEGVDEWGRECVTACNNWDEFHKWRYAYWDSAYFMPETTFAGYTSEGHIIQFDRQGLLHPQNMFKVKTQCSVYYTSSTTSVSSFVYSF